MDFTVLIIICVLYGIVMFLDLFFKSCMMLPYIEFLKSSGISIKFFRIQIHTNAFNRLINRYSSKFPSIYRRSFKFGFYISMILMPFSICLMVLSLFSSIDTSTSSTSVTSYSYDVKETERAHLEILLPGVNLPLNQIVYYVLALLICSIVHEAGHGIAAVSEIIFLIIFI